MVNDYGLFTRLPLFQGISSTDLLHWEDVLRLDIDELSASKLPLIRQGDTCTQLLWLVEGELQRVHQSATYATHSCLKAPAIIEIDRLYGLTPTYIYTYFAKTDIKMLSIRKSLVSSHLMKSEVFRLNMLNMLSALAQKRALALRPCQLNNAEEKLKHFLRTLFFDSEGEVELIIKMTELARLIGERRLTVSQLLNHLQEQGAIRLGRGHFTVFNIEALK